MKKVLGGIPFLLIFPVSFLLGQSGYYQIIEKKFQATSERSLEVMLNVDAGEVVVEKSTDPYLGEILMRYVREEFRSKIDFNQKRNRLKIYLRKTNWFKFKRNHYRRDHTKTEVKVSLPYGVDIFFDSKIKAGEVTMKMGGLRIREFYLDNWAGEVEVRFDKPNPILMNSMDIDAKVGEITLVNLGNARFKKANINGGIGEINMDFSGKLLSESRARVDLDIGEAVVSLPRDIGIKMRIGGSLSFLSSKDIDQSFYRRGDYYYSDDYQTAGKKFFLYITPGLGQLTIERE